MGLIGREEAWFDFFCMRSKYSEELISGKKAMAKGVDPLATTYVKSQSVKLFRFDHKSRQNTPEACTSNDPHPQQGQRIPKQKKMQKLVLLHCSMQSPFRYRTKGIHRIPYVPPAPSTLLLRNNLRCEL